MQVTSITNHNFNSYPVKTQRSVNHSPKNLNFTGYTPESKFFKPITDACASAFNKLTDAIAKGSASVLNKNFVTRIVEFTERKKIDIVKHISAGIGVIISGLYIYKTLSNTKLDSEKKTTLAINQGIVSVTATSLGYMATGAMNKHIDKFVRKYSAANINHKELSVLRKGLGGAVGMMVFGLMYRYVAPVLVTPIANNIGNRIQAAKEAGNQALAIKA